MADRDEVVELMARAICDCKLWQNAFDAECEGNQIEWRFMASAALDALAERYALVPRVATEKMLEAACEASGCPRSFDWVRKQEIDAAIATGDILPKT